MKWGTPGKLFIVHLSEAPLGIDYPYTHDLGTLFEALELATLSSEISEELSESKLVLCRRGTLSF